MVNVTVFLIGASNLINYHLNIGVHHVVTRKDNIMTKEMIDIIPSNWCDPLLTGDKKVIDGPPYNCRDIENLLNALRKRIKLFTSQQVGAELDTKWNHTGFCLGDYDNNCFDDCPACYDCLKLYKKEKQGEVL